MTNGDVRLTAATKARLQTVADALQVTPEEALREIVDDAYNQVIGAFRRRADEQSSAERGMQGYEMPPGAE